MRLRNRSQELPSPTPITTYHTLAGAEIEPHGYLVQKEANLLMRFGYVMGNHAGSITWTSYLPDEITIHSYQLIVERTAVST